MKWICSRIGNSVLEEKAAEMFPRNPEIRFVAVGTGGEEETVRHLAQRLNVWQKNFFLLPQMKKSEVPAVVNAADLCSSWVVNRPPLWKNSANKVFDAMSVQFCGCSIDKDEEKPERLGVPFSCD